MYISADIAEKIKSVAKQKNVTVKKLLEDVGLGFNTMSNMKTSMPKIASIAAIADYLNCSVDYLLGRTDDMQSHLGAQKKQPRTIKDAGLKKVVDDYNKCDEHGKETIQHIAHSEAERTHKQQYVVLEGIAARSGAGKVEMPREKFEKLLKEIGLRPEDLNK